jgi:hypothetical protein
MRLRDRTVADFGERPVMKRLEAVLLADAKPSPFEVTDDIHSRELDSVSDARRRREDCLAGLGRVRSQQN